MEAKISECTVTGIKYFYLSKYLQIKLLETKARAVLKKLQEAEDMQEVILKIKSFLKNPGPPLVD